MMLRLLLLTSACLSVHTLSLSPGKRQWQKPESLDSSRKASAAVSLLSKSESKTDDDTVTGEAEAVYRPPPMADVNLLKEFIRVEGDPKMVALDPVVDDDEYAADPSAAPKAFEMKNLGMEPVVLALEDSGLNNYKLRLEKTAKEGVQPLHRVRTHTGPSSVYQALVPAPTYPTGSSGHPADSVPPSPESILAAITKAVGEGASLEDLTDVFNTASAVPGGGEETNEVSAAAVPAVGEETNEASATGQ